MRLFDLSLSQVDNENIAAHFRIGIQIRRTGLMRQMTNAASVRHMNLTTFLQFSVSRIEFIHENRIQPQIRGIYLFTNHEARMNMGAFLPHRIYALALMANQIRLNHIHSVFIRPIYANRSIHVVADQKISCVGRHFQMTRRASG